MKKLIALIIVLVMIFSLVSCKSEIKSPGTHADSEAQEEYEHDHDHENETEEETHSHTHSTIESYLPSDWAGRYTLIEEENVSLDVYCKAAYGNTEGNGWLFRLMLMDAFPDYLPNAANLGTYNGKVIVGIYPTDVEEIDDKVIAEDYIDMLGDVEEILHELLHALGGEHDHTHISQDSEIINGKSDKANEKVAAGTYLPPEKLGITDTMVGVFRLDTTRWEKKFMDEFLGENHHHGYLSISADGTAYLILGHETIEGKAHIYSDYNNLPANMSMYRLSFNGKTSYANLDHGVLTVDDMEEYTDISGLKGTTWTFIHESDEWWTEDNIEENIH
ncbi:MAG: hypothetical protein E7456_00985 [Ruminococcaceae bacterium]|nr:hypothetical protein [Oscillospiraceae bacterium]